jgi:hypothetical protein
MGSLPQEKQTDTSGYCGRVMLLEEMLALVTTTWTSWLMRTAQESVRFCIYSYTESEKP